MASIIYKGRQEITGGGTVDWTDFVAQDPYYQNVVLYLPCDGANNSTEIYDYAYNTIVNPSLNGSPIITTSVKKYGQSSLYLNGSSWLTLPNTSKWQFGTGNFTLECWAYGLSPGGGVQYSSANYCLFFGGSPDVGAGTASWASAFNMPTSGSGDSVGFFSATGQGSWNVVNSNSGVLPVTIKNNNTWNHYAFVRSGNNLLIFFNGILRSTTAFLQSSMPNPSSALGIGASTTGNFRSIGYFDSIRITKGVARYTANFDPETDTYLAYS